MTRGVHYETLPQQKDSARDQDESSNQLEEEGAGLELRYSFQKPDWNQIDNEYLIDLYNYQDQHFVVFG